MRVISDLCTVIYTLLGNEGFQWRYDLIFKYTSLVVKQWELRFQELWSDIVLAGDFLTVFRNYLHYIPEQSNLT